MFYFSVVTIYEVYVVVWSICSYSFVSLPRCIVNAIFIIYLFVLASFDCLIRYHYSCDKLTTLSVSFKLFKLWKIFSSIYSVLLFVSKRRYRKADTISCLIKNYIYASGHHWQIHISDHYMSPTIVRYLLAHAQTKMPRFCNLVRDATTSYFFSFWEGTENHGKCLWPSALRCETDTFAWIL